VYLIPKRKECQRMSIGFISEDRPSDSPYVESVMRGISVGEGSLIRPAEANWHMVFSRVNGRMYPIVVGALTTSGSVSVTEGVEILWIKFKLGTWLPHLPIKEFLDRETILPEASSQSFWLKSSAWEFPDFENADTFADRLARDEILVRDPVVDAALQDQLPDMSLRTVRHRFLRTTGMTQTHIRQFKRAQQAMALLGQGVPILDVTYQLGYFDQPHLTRSLKQFTGYTPAQVLRVGEAV
jgi:AraC-like DNA-binding protein